MDRVTDRIRHALTTGECVDLMPADLDLPIYARACEILSMPVDQRRAEIERHPLADLLAAEVKRVWGFRRTVMRTSASCGMIAGH